MWPEIIPTFFFFFAIEFLDRINCPDINKYMFIDKHFSREKMKLSYFSTFHNYYHDTHEISDFVPQCVNPPK